VACTLGCAAGGGGESWLAGLGWSVQGSVHFIAGDFRYVVLGDGNARSSLLQGSGNKVAGLF